MKRLPTRIECVLLFEPRIFRDERGYFLETWSQAKYAAQGLGVSFVQDNVSNSRQGVLRGLHYQHPVAQGKLVSVLRGEVFDVAVDIRRGSPTFGKWEGYNLSADNGRQLYIPEGFAHGFLVLSEDAIFSYKCTGPYDPPSEGSVIWNDPAIGIEWPGEVEPILAPKDAAAPKLADIPPDRLPNLV